jgi:TonB family protein
MVSPFICSTLKPDHGRRKQSLKIISATGLCIALLLAGCASTGSKEVAGEPDAAKPAIKPDAGKPAKRSNAAVPKVKEEPQAGEQPDIKEKPQTRDLGLPIAIVPANYPQNALDKGIEGYVILEFTVTKTGSLKDIKVIDSSPHGYFEHDAINAAYKFRYEPKIVNGEPVEVPRAQYKMVFKLEYILPKK